MTSKSLLISEAVKELRKAQTARWEPPPGGPVKRPSFPPALSLGDGRTLSATDALVRAVSDYNQICWNNDPSLKPRFRIDELYKLTERSFAIALAEIDLGRSDADLHSVVSDRVQELLRIEVDRHHQPIDLTVGCHLFEGDELYPIQIGPVLFETREGWRQRMLAAGKLSPTTARRLAAHWEGKRPKGRKRSFDSAAERTILDAVAHCPIVCTVATEGLSSKLVQEKGLLAARLAMTAISLSWSRPSEGLRWMKLLYDRRLSHRRTALFGSGTNVGGQSELGDLPSGRYFDPELLNVLLSYRSLFDQVGEALFAYVQPDRSNARPISTNALFLSLWWYHEACREPQDQIATTKFAASMDTLAAGGKAKGIGALIESRLGIKPDDPLITDGQTTRATVAQIYDASRSRLLHGSSDNFAHDWTQVRAKAEVIGRLLLTECCDWLIQNPSVDDLLKLKSL